MSYGQQNPLEACGADYLACLDNAYSDAEVRQSSSFLFPEGKYQAYVNGAKMARNERIDALQLTLSLTILGGPCDGYHVSKFYPLTPEAIGRLKNDMVTLGIDLSEGIINLGRPEILEAMLDKVVDLTIKHKQKANGNGVYQNVYINRYVGTLADTPIEDDGNPFGN